MLIFPAHKLNILKLSIFHCLNPYLSVVGAQISSAGYDYSYDAIPLVLDVADCRLMLPLASYLGFCILLVLSLSVARPWLDHQKTNAEAKVGVDPTVMGTSLDLTGKIKLELSLTRFVASFQLTVTGPSPKLEPENLVHPVAGVESEKSCIRSAHHRHGHSAVELRADVLWSHLAELPWQPWLLVVTGAMPSRLGRMFCFQWAL